MSTLVKVCRDCGEEYRPEATRCSDCGGELEDRLLDESGAFLDAEQGAHAPEAAPEDLSSHRVVFVSPRAVELVPLAEALRAAAAMPFFFRSVRASAPASSRAAGSSTGTRTSPGLSAGSGSLSQARSRCLNITPSHEPCLRSAI